jgi:hypothetical protein
MVRFNKQACRLIVWQASTMSNVLLIIEFIKATSITRNEM